MNSLIRPVRRTMPLLAFAVLAMLLPAAQAAQVSELKAVHREGQTFLTWQEADSPTTDEALTIPAFKALMKEWTPKVAYRIYRSDKPIASVQGLTAVGETGPLSCWNNAFPDAQGHTFKPTDPMTRFVIAEGQPPLTLSTGLYVHNPATAELAQLLLHQGQAGGGEQRQAGPIGQAGGRPERGGVVEQGLVRQAGRAGEEHELQHLVVEDRQGQLDQTGVATMDATFRPARGSRLQLAQIELHTAGHALGALDQHACPVLVGGTIGMQPVGQGQRQVVDHHPQAAERLEAADGQLGRMLHAGHA
jgi:hypothetical protein